MQPKATLSLILTASTLFGCSADGLIWMPPSSKADPLFRVIIDDKAGFIDAKGKIVIAPTLRPGSNWGQAFHDGMLSLALVRNGPLSGFIDRTGEMRIKVDYTKAESFSEGYAVIQSDGGYEYIDTNGKNSFGRQFVVASRFHHGLAHVLLKGQMYAGGDYAYLDKSGNQVFKYTWRPGSQ